VPSLDFKLKIFKFEEKIMRTIDVELNGKKGVGIEVALPKAPLVLVKGERGFVMCGYLNIDAAEKLGESAAVVRGVKTVDDLLKARVVEATTAAKTRGIEVGMSGKEALSYLL
jgi:uncharacterized protein YunC (DUF1805 family)